MDNRKIHKMCTKTTYLSKSSGEYGHSGGNLGSTNTFSAYSFIDAPAYKLVVDDNRCLCEDATLCFDILCVTEVNAADRNGRAANIDNI